MKSLSMSIKDFKEIIDTIDFSYDTNDLILCIKCEDTNVYFKFIMGDSNISTYYINDSVTMDVEDLLLMFEYKFIGHIIEKTNNGSIKFELINNKIKVIVTNSIEIKTEFINTVDDQLLGEIELPDPNIKIDSFTLQNMLKYFIRPSKNLSKYFFVNYLFVSSIESELTLEMNNLTVSKKIKENIQLDKFKLHIDCLYNFIKNKNYNLDIHISQDFPIVCRAETDLGTIELYSAPICD